MVGELEFRRAVAADRRSIMELCRAALGWNAGDPDEDFYAWKHDDNPFGESPTWVAVDDAVGVIGLRVFLRWEFIDGRGVVRRAVRAVDTATHPDFQGRGIFSKLTLAAVEELTKAGVDCVFNTPNSKSMPGYLKMGWHQLGQVKAAARFSGPSGLIRAGQARTPADLWSLPTSAGLPAVEALNDDSIRPLLERRSLSEGWKTARSAAFFQWRYRFAPLQYRAFPLGDRLDDGVILFRLRRRGVAVEAALCDIVRPKSTTRRQMASAIRSLRRESGADYLLATSSSVSPTHGFVSLPSMGPELTWRPLASDVVPALHDLSLVLGDLELF